MNELGRCATWKSCAHYAKGVICWFLRLDSIARQSSNQPENCVLAYAEWLRQLGTRDNACLCMTVEVYAHCNGTICVINGCALRTCHVGCCWRLWRHMYLRGALSFCDRHGPHNDCVRDMIQRSGRVVCMCKSCSQSEITITCYARNPTSTTQQDTQAHKFLCQQMLCFWSRTLWLCVACVGVETSMFTMIRYHCHLIYLLFERWLVSGIWWIQQCNYMQQTFSCLFCLADHKCFLPKQHVVSNLHFHIHKITTANNRASGFMQAMWTS